jgi:hypothetical protein
VVAVRGAVGRGDEAVAAALSGEEWGNGDRGCTSMGMRRKS